MGRYINFENNGDKDAGLLSMGADLVPTPTAWEDIPEDKGAICVVDNGFFKAAGYCYSERELDAFSAPTDPRPKNWYFLDKDKAEEFALPR